MAQTPANEPNQAQETRTAKSPWPKRLLIGAIILVACVGLIVGGVALDRALKMKSGDAGAFSPIFFNTSSTDGRFTTDIMYRIEKAETRADDDEQDAALGEQNDEAKSSRESDNGETAGEQAAETTEVTATVLWDDQWFFADSAEYNHELAEACAVISAAADADAERVAAMNSDAEDGGAEAGKIRGIPRGESCTEQALKALGFKNVTTSKFQPTDDASDATLHLFAGDDSLGAYTIATKRITSKSGDEKVLAIVCPHVACGDDWTDRLEPDGRDADDDADSDDADDAAVDADGGGETATETTPTLASAIMADLANRADKHPGENVALLFCGSGQSGAVANLAAAFADSTAIGPRSIAKHDSIFAYTFGSPATTASATASNSTYDNIFNIVNPADAVAAFPLGEWGYTRYGANLTLPSAEGKTFKDRSAKMLNGYKRLTGEKCAFDPDDEQILTAFCSELAERSAGTANSPDAVAEAIAEIGPDLATDSMETSHSATAYVAWMQATSGKDLDREPAVSAEQSGASE